jgi:hypothetical protein
MAVAKRILNVVQADGKTGLAEALNLQNGGPLIDRCGGVRSDLSGGTCQCEQNNKEKSKTEAHRQ